MDSMTINLLILGVAVVTLLVVGFQVYLMLRQLNIMKRQDQILNRRANLVLEVHSQYNNDQHTDRTLSFSVENNGNKAAKDFYWHLMIPHRFAQARELLIAPRRQVLPENNLLTIDNTQYTQYRCFHAEPVYPKRTNRLCSLRFDGNNVAHPITIYWKISAEDGVFPEGEGVARLDIPA